MSASIGERIKALRSEQRMTLADLSEKAKLSISYLSQIERDNAIPSLSSLFDIAKSLNVSPRDLFEVEAETAYILRVGTGQNNLPADTPIVRLHLTPDGGNNMLEVYRVILQPHASLEQLNTFPGEELCFVLSGKLTVKVGDEQYILAVGDSVHYDASQPFYYINTGDEPCIVIWAYVHSSLEQFP